MDRSSRATTPATASGLLHGDGPVEEDPKTLLARLLLQSRERAPSVASPVLPPLMAASLSITGAAGTPPPSAGAMVHAPAGRGHQRLWMTDVRRAILREASDAVSLRKATPGFREASTVEHLLQQQKQGAGISGGDPAAAYVQAHRCQLVPVSERATDYIPPEDPTTAAAMRSLAVLPRPLQHLQRRVDEGRLLLPVTSAQEHRDVLRKIAVANGVVDADETMRAVLSAVDRVLSNAAPHVMCPELAAEQQRRKRTSVASASDTFQLSPISRRAQGGPSPGDELSASAAVKRHLLRGFAERHPHDVVLAATRAIGDVHASKMRAVRRRRGQNLHTHLHFKDVFRDMGASSFPDTLMHASADDVQRCRSGHVGAVLEGERTHDNRDFIARIPPLTVTAPPEAAHSPPPSHGARSSLCALETSVGLGSVRWGPGVGHTSITATSMGGPRRGSDAALAHALGIAPLPPSRSATPPLPLLAGGMSSVDVPLATFDPCLVGEHQIPASTHVTSANRGGTPSASTTSAVTMTNRTPHVAVFPSGAVSTTPVGVGGAVPMEMWAHGRFVQTLRTALKPAALGGGRRVVFASDAGLMKAPTSGATGSGGLTSLADEGLFSSSSLSFSLASGRDTSGAGNHSHGRGIAMFRLSRDERDILLSSPPAPDGGIGTDEPSPMEALDSCRRGSVDGMLLTSARAASSVTSLLETARPDATAAASASRRVSAGGTPGVGAVPADPAAASMAGAGAIHARPELLEIYAIVRADVAANVGADAFDIGNVPDDFEPTCVICWSHFRAGSGPNAALSSAPAEEPPQRSGSGKKRRGRKGSPGEGGGGGNGGGSGSRSGSPAGLGSGSPTASAVEDRRRSSLHNVLTALKDGASGRTLRRSDSLRSSISSSFYRMVVPSRRLTAEDVKVEANERAELLTAAARAEERLTHWKAMHTHVNVLKKQELLEAMAVRQACSQRVNRSATHLAKLANTACSASRSWSLSRASQQTRKSTSLMRGERCGSPEALNTSTTDMPSARNSLGGGGELVPMHRSPSGERPPLAPTDAPHAAHGRRPRTLWETPLEQMEKGAARWTEAILFWDRLQAAVGAVGAPRDAAECEALNLLRTMLVHAGRVTRGMFFVWLRAVHAPLAPPPTGTVQHTSMSGSTFRHQSSMLSISGHGAPATDDAFRVSREAALSIFLAPMTFSRRGFRLVLLLRVLFEIPHKALEAWARAPAQRRAGWNVPPEDAPTSAFPVAVTAK